MPRLKRRLDDAFKRPMLSTVTEFRPDIIQVRLKVGERRRTVRPRTCPALVPHPASIVAVPSHTARVVCPDVESSATGETGGRNDFKSRLQGVGVSGCSHAANPNETCSGLQSAGFWTVIVGRKGGFEAVADRPDVETGMRRVVERQQEATKGNGFSVGRRRARRVLVPSSLPANAGSDEGRTRPQPRCFSTGCFRG